MKLPRSIPAGLVIACACLPGHAQAQTWTVGVPVDEELIASLNIDAMCYPDPVIQLTVAPSAVTGVQYIAVITGVVPEGVFSISHPIASGIPFVGTGDTLPLTNVDFPYAIHTPGNTGVIAMDFRAVGMPTVAGEAYSCGFNDWQAGGGSVCPANLWWAANNSCFVQVSTGIATAGGPAPALVAQANRVRVDGAAVDGNYAVIDAFGRTVRTGSAIALVQGIDLGELPSGAYTVDLVTAQGERCALRIGTVRQ